MDERKKARNLLHEWLSPPPLFATVKEHRHDTLQSLYREKHFVCFSSTKQSLCRSRKKSISLLVCNSVSRNLMFRHSLIDVKFFRTALLLKTFNLSLYFILFSFNKQIMSVIVCGHLRGTPTKYFAVWTTQSSIPPTKRPVSLRVWTRFASSADLWSLITSHYNVTWASMTGGLQELSP